MQEQLWPWEKHKIHKNENFVPQRGTTSNKILLVNYKLNYEKHYCIYAPATYKHFSTNACELQHSFYLWQVCLKRFCLLTPNTHFSYLNANIPNCFNSVGCEHNNPWSLHYISFFIFFSFLPLLLFSQMGLFLNFACGPK